jgi:hypothetical protein
MNKLASIVKGYTLGTMFVLVHGATHALRSRSHSEKTGIVFSGTGPR